VSIIVPKLALNPVYPIILEIGPNNNPMFDFVSLFDSLFNPLNVGTIKEVTLSLGNLLITELRAFKAYALTSASLSFIKVQIG
jgi:hypothetical protein